MGFNSGFKGLNASLIYLTVSGEWGDLIRVFMAAGQFPLTP